MPIILCKQGIDPMLLSNERFCFEPKMFCSWVCLINSKIGQRFQNKETNLNHFFVFIKKWVKTLFILKFQSAKLF